MCLLDYIVCLGDTNDLDACFGKTERQLNGSHIYLPYFHGISFVTSKFYNRCYINLYLFILII